MVFRGLFAFWCGAFLLAGTIPAQITVTWGGSSSTNFADVDNWSPSAPANNVAILDTTAPNPALSIDYSVAGLRFGSGAAGFAFSGSGTLTIGSSGIENLSSSTQSISVPLVFDGDTRSVINHGSLTLSGNITNNTSTGLVFSGTGVDGTVSGPITGAGKIEKAGTGTWIFSGANDYSGGTSVTSGTLRLGANGALPISRAVTVSPNASGSMAQLDLGATTQTAGALTLGGVAGSRASISMSPGGKLTLASDVVFDGTNDPNGAFISGGTLELGGTRTFNIGDAAGAFADLTVSSFISGATSSLTKTGAGGLWLDGPNTFGGGVDVNAGKLLLGGDGAAGTGRITLASGTTLAAVPRYFYGNVSVANEVWLNSNVTLGDERRESALEFSGSVTAQGIAGTAGPVATVHLAGDTAHKITGTLAAASSGTTIAFDGGGMVMLGGATDATVSTITADGAGISFATNSALPSAVQAINQGYIGVLASDPADVPLAQQPTAATLIGRIADKGAFAGTLGFDTRDSDDDRPRVFEDNLDLSAFTHANFTIGSATGAVLTGEIKPAGSGYRFGNGGGVLVVESNLGGNYGVTVSSPLQRATTLILRGNNTFTGDLSIANSAVVLDSPSAMPAGNAFALSGIAYLGATEAFMPADEFVTFFAGGGGFAALTATGPTSAPPSAKILGFDSHAHIEGWLSGSEEYHRPDRRITENINLNGSGLAGVFLGTLSRAEITGIVTAYGAGELKLVALDEGHLTISSSLQSGNVSSVSIGSVDLHADGVVKLANSANNYTGGTILYNGTLLVNGSSHSSGGPLGTGALMVPSGAEEATFASSDINGSVIDNPIDIGATLHLGFFEDEYDRRPGSLTLRGNIDGSGSLVNFGRTILEGASSYTGKTVARDGMLIFGTPASLPGTEATGSGILSVESGAYIGFGFVPANIKADLLDRFDSPTSFGTVGFDTLDGAALNVFGNVDLTGFDHAPLLGSATTAKISGTITPSDDWAYWFGGGGGKLEVSSALSDASPGQPRNVHVSSPSHASLTLLLSGANTYTGDTVVWQSAVIFTPAALPAVSGTADFWLNTGGYIGLQLPAVTTTDTTDATDIGSFLSHFPTTTGEGFFGLDSSDATREVLTALDLSGLGSGVYLGTTSNLKISGTLAFNDGNFRFAGYKGGQLEIATKLEGAGKRVVVGDPETPATQGGDGVRSRVTLTGDNTYSGGTTLYTGELVVGSNTALGTGDLTVEQVYFGRPGNAALSPSVGGLTLANAIDLETGLDVNVASGRDFTLAGVISSVGATWDEFAEIYKIGFGRLILSGANTWDGGIYIREGEVVFNHATAAGLGPLQLGVSGGLATFAVDGTVHGIFSDDTASQINLNPGVDLTIDQSFNSRFAGRLGGDSTTSILFQGSDPMPARLWLTGNSSTTFSGSATIAPGIIVVAANNNAFGSGTNPITLNGGGLAVADGFTLTNPLVLTSGQLGGSGTFKPATALTIGANVALAPGDGHPGRLNVDGSLIASGPALTLAGGGRYDWDLMDATNAAGGWDVVSVTVTDSVNITATETNPFNFRLTPFTSTGLLSLPLNFNPSAEYSWAVLTAGAITGFTSTNQFAIDSSSSLLSFAAGGTFDFSLNASSTSLMLNFTPVPEPSTYVMLGFGAVVIIYTIRRRRKV